MRLGSGAVPSLKAPLLSIRWLARTLSSLRSAARTARVSLLTLLAESTALRFGPGKLGVSEYLGFRLFSRHLSLAKKKQFLGWRVERLVQKKVNRREWSVVSSDKLLFYQVMRSLELPIPALHAVYHPDSRFTGSVPTSVDRDSVRDLICSVLPSPFFSKPIHGWHGRRACLVETVDRTKNCVRLGNGSSVAIEEYLDRWILPEVSGCLFQEALRPHPAMDTLTGGRLCTVRFVVLHNRGSASIHRAVLKLCAGTNMHDNFHHGNSGNLLGAIDLQTGELRRVVSGVGFGQREETAHPDTGKRFERLRLPDWHRVAELVENAARALPGFRLQSWDIALSARGPVILEMSVPADLDLVQHAYGYGVMDESLQRFVETDDGKRG